MTQLQNEIGLPDKVAAIVGNLTSANPAEQAELSFILPRVQSLCASVPAAAKMNGVAVTVAVGVIPNGRVQAMYAVNPLNLAV